MLRLFSALLLLAASSPAPAAETSEPAPLAPRSLLLDVDRAGERIVAVGDRGHVLTSTDQGATWKQSLTPTRAMLTGVSFADAQHGWAVGHDGVILATSDGGGTWQRQDTGDDLDTVYLDVLFLDARRGFVIGAYGRFMTTHDGGKTWSPGKPTEDDMHFNRITRAPDGTLYLIGESGTFLVSDDDGATWQRRELPYEGSLFAAVAIADRGIVVAGLRGNILTSRDRGTTWKENENDVTVLISASVRRADGTIVLAGQGGNFFLSRDDGATFTHWKPANFGTSIAELLPLADGVLSVGEAGVVRHQLPNL